MQKATLTGRQVRSAVFAGILGHLLFAAGWIALGAVLLGGIIVGILGGAASSIGGLFSSEGIAGVFDQAGGIVGGVLLGLVIGALVLMVLGYLISGAILKRGTVRKPWGTTWTAVLIAALVDVPLLVAYFAIARSTEGIPFLLIAFIGTVVIGILIWLWMTFAHRGSASAFADAKNVTASGVATPIATPPAE